MSMVTTCPNCATSFNVAPEVLLSRNGRVRCGKCKQIFDGLLSVTTLESFQSIQSFQSAPAEPDIHAAPAPALPAAPAEAYWPALPGTPDVPVPPMPLEVTAAASPEYLARNESATALAAEQPVSAPAVDAPSPRTTPSRRSFNDSATEEEAFYDKNAVQPNPTRRIWAVAAMLASLLLAGQVIYRYRSELAAHFPPIRPALAQACVWAGCSVPPLQQPAALNIEASDLQVVDKAQPHLVQLTATLRNRAAVDVAYPAFDLVLTDSREHALARRVILPKDYLPGAAALAAQSSIAANAEITVRVDMDLGGLPAAGFRLNLTSAPRY